MSTWNFDVLSLLTALYITLFQNRLLLKHENVAGTVPFLIVNKWSQEIIIFVKVQDSWYQMEGVEWSMNVKDYEYYSAICLLEVTVNKRMPLGELAGKHKLVQTHSQYAAHQHLLC